MGKVPRGVTPFCGQIRAYFLLTRRLADIASSPQVQNDLDLKDLGPIGHIWFDEMA